MKEKIKNYIIILFIIIVFILIIINSNLVIENSLTAIEVWKKSIFPILFPTFIIIDLLINYDFISILSHILYKPFYKIFHFNKEELYIFFISLLGGFPSSSKYTAYFYNKNQISLDNANRMLMCSHFSNPAFILGTINSLFPYKKLCIIILISHYLGNFILAFYTREYQEYNLYKRKEKNNLSFSDCLSNSITNNTKTLLFILGSITIFYILSALITNNILGNEILSSIISGILEMTQGIVKITSLKIPLNIKGILITFFLSFGGLCIHIQTIGMIKNTNISYLKFLKGRIIHSTLSIIFYIIINKLF